MNYNEKIFMEESKATEQPTANPSLGKIIEDIESKLDCIYEQISIINDTFFVGSLAEQDKIEHATGSYSYHLLEILRKEDFIQNLLRDMLTKI